jgi:L,D-transpeptidase ErfK/SrfK
MVRTLKSILVLMLISGWCHADIFELGAGSTVVGEIRRTYSRLEQTLPDIARNNSLGYYEIKRANPAVDTWTPGDRQEIVLPKQFVLPVAPHRGIIINIPEMRLYYFPQAGNGDTRKVITYPIGIGREGRQTPYVITKIIQKTEKPTWYPPESIRVEHAAQGDPLPKMVPPGPDNPLGDFAMRLGLPSYLIHGTNKPYGVGMRVSSGCIRLYPEHIQALFQQVTLGTPVRIVNQPYKIGLQDDIIYLEAKPFLEEDAHLFDGNLTSVVKMLVSISNERKYDVNWDLAKQIIDEQAGIPVEIGRMLDVPMNEYTGADKRPR